MYFAAANSATNTAPTFFALAATVLAASSHCDVVLTLAVSTLCGNDIGQCNGEGTTTAQRSVTLW